MINGKISQFLDTGWYSESTLYFDGYIYWCEADTDIETGITEFIVDRWKAEMGEDMLYHSLLNSQGELVECERVWSYCDSDMDKIKQAFLSEKIFAGNAFWDVESKIAWLEEGSSKSVP